MLCTVKLIWDDESRTWYTSSEDVPGLLLESNSFDALIERVRMAAPEMLELNCNHTGEVQVSFESERLDSLRSLDSLRESDSSRELAS